MNDIIELAVRLAKKDVGNYSLTEAEESLRTEVKKLASDYNSYRRNQLTIFELIQAVADEIVPVKVIESMGAFADVKNFGQGERPVFKRKLGKRRGKSFITRAALSGIYETFRLDNDTVEVPTLAYGGAGVIEFERWLDGTVDFVDISNIILEGLEDAVYEEIETALIATYASMPAANVHSDAGIDATELVRILNTVGAYGGNATIFCGRQFAANLIPVQGFAASAEADRIDMRNQGYLGRFAGAPVVIMPNSFTGPDNATQVLNPGYAYIMATGGAAAEKPIKVSFEGQTIVDEIKNRDRSMEIQAYKKFGVAAINTNYYGIYRDTNLG